MWNIGESSLSWCKKSYFFYLFRCIYYISIPTEIPRHRGMLVQTTTEETTTLALVSVSAYCVDTVDVCRAEWLHTIQPVVGFTLSDGVCLCLCFNSCEHHVLSERSMILKRHKTGDKLFIFKVQIRILVQSGIADSRRSTRVNVCGLQTLSQVQKLGLCVLQFF